MEVLLSFLSNLLPTVYDSESYLISTEHRDSRWLRTNRQAPCVYPKKIWQKDHMKFEHMALPCASSFNRMFYDPYRAWGRAKPRKPASHRGLPIGWNWRIGATPSTPARLSVSYNHLYWNPQLTNIQIFGTSLVIHHIYGWVAIHQGSSIHGVV